jgi:hypothetical protein
MEILQEDKYKFLIISCSILLIMRTVLDKIPRESKNMNFTFNYFFFKNLFIYGIERRNIVEPDGLEI